jgi:hypothetical protein
MKKTKKLEPRLILADGSEGVRRFRTDYWYDRRLKTPFPYLRGFPKSEDGSIEGAGRIIMKGHCAQIACFDRVKGAYRWTLERGAKVPGTNLYQVVAYAGGPRRLGR